MPQMSLGSRFLLALKEDIESAARCHFVDFFLGGFRLDTKEHRYFCYSVYGQLLGHNFKFPLTILLDLNAWTPYASNE